MGSIWDDGDDDEIRPMETNPVVDYANTQPIDGQISSPPPSDEKADFGDTELVQDIFPFNDTVPVEDALETEVLNLACETQVMDIGDETQVMDFGDETQVMDFGGETQAMDIGIETQVMDFGDENQIMDFGDETQIMDFGDETQIMDFGGETQKLGFGSENMKTQLLEFDDEIVSDTESENSDKTQVLDDDEDLTDDESVRKGAGQLADEVKIHCTPCENMEKELMKRANHSVDEKHNAGLHVSTLTPVNEGSLELNPGSVHTHVTSVHLASFRVSGLAARNTASSSEFRSFPSSKSPDQLSGKGLGRCNEEMRSRNDNKCKTGSSTVRKLFTDDSEAEDEGFPSNRNSGEGEDLLQFPCNLSGLSYIDSQEPADLSQANALDFVDRFLHNNLEELDKEVDHGNSARKNSKFVSSSKGPQTLAKKSSYKCMVQQTGIFDWDDNHEDEEGGDFFRRRKADFFEGGSHGWRSLPQPQKAKGKRRGEQKDHKKQLQGKNKNMGVGHSDSKLLLHNSKVEKEAAQENKMEVQKNLASEFDEQFNTDFPREQSDANVNRNNVPEMLNVGIDTQMAAEAIEALFYGEEIFNCDASGAHQGFHGNPKTFAEDLMGEKTKNRICPKKFTSQKRGRISDVGVASQETGQAKKMRLDAKSSKCSSVSPQDYVEHTTKSQKAKSNAEKHHKINRNKNSEKMPSFVIGLRAEGYAEKHLQQGSGTFTPIARQTTRSMVNQLKKAGNASSDCGEESSYQAEDVATIEKIISMAGSQPSEDWNAKSSKLGPKQSGEIGKNKPSQHDDSDLKFGAISNGTKLDTLRVPRGKRSPRNLSSQVYRPDISDDPSEQPENVGKHVTGHRRMRGGAKRVGADINSTRKKRSSTSSQNLAGNFSDQSLKGGPGEAGLHHNTCDKDGRMISEVITSEEAVRKPKKKGGANPSSAAKMTDEVSGEKCKPCASACPTPVRKRVPVNDSSPICMGNEYFEQSCKRSLSRRSLLKEIRDLSANGSEQTSPAKDLRKRRDMTEVRVLYSNHLDEDIIKKQKKILARLGVSVASSMTDATHFIADQFVRTRNMLEAIASGKPVVTHLWLDSCGQAGCFIDEKSHILRDSKKEKEFGFSMPASLVRACQHPLLEDRKVFITPNTKPGKEIISKLVKAVKGQPVERIGRSAVKADKVPDDLLVISCEEDYEICMPLLEKGAAVYSSELVLNGIVTQKLEFQRHLLFTDQVKKTRSTIWLRKNGNGFLPVTKNK